MTISTPREARGDRPQASDRVQAQAAKAMLAVDRRLGRPSDPRIVQLAKRAR